MFFKKAYSLAGNQRGQAILIIVLVMVVALTVGLSVATRTITNLRNSQDQANSQKALSAAEAGVEQSIKNNASIGTSSNPQGLGNNTSYSTVVSAVSGTKFVIGGSVSPLSKDEGGFLWLDTPPWSSPWSPSGNTNVSFYWGEDVNACNNAALEIAVVSGTSPSTAVVRRYAVDPCPTATRGNNFTLATSAGNSVSGHNFRYSYTIPVQNGYLIKVLPIYANAYVAVNSSITFPQQGKTITSTGTSDTATRTVNVYQGYAEVPTEFFPYSLFSP